jgi:hypothetical protein
MQDVQRGCEGWRLLAAEGLTSTSQGTRVKFSGDKPPSSTAPSPSQGGRRRLHDPSGENRKEEAIEWVKRAAPTCFAGEGIVEIRMLMDVENLGKASRRTRKSRR